MHHGRFEKTVDLPRAGPLFRALQGHAVVQVDLASRSERKQPLAREAFVPRAVLAPDTVSLVTHERPESVVSKIAARDLRA
jgi:hypothetical protein